MPNAILFAMVQLLETIVNWSLGALLIAAGIAGTIAASRWLTSRGTSDAMVGGTFAAARPGKQSLTLAAILAFGYGCLVAGMSFWTR